MCICLYRDTHVLRASQCGGLLSHIRETQIVSDNTRYVCWIIQGADADVWCGFCSLRAKDYIYIYTHTNTLAHTKSHSCTVIHMMLSVGGGGGCTSQTFTLKLWCRLELYVYYTHIPIYMYIGCICPLTDVSGKTRGEVDDAVSRERFCIWITLLADARDAQERAHHSPRECI